MENRQSTVRLDDFRILETSMTAQNAVTKNRHTTLALTDLVTRAQNGETGALDTLIVRFQNMAIGLAAALLGGMGGTPGAEDVAQEAFVEALRRLPDLQHPAAFPSLLQSLVRKHADRITRRRALHAVPLDDATAIHATLGDPAKELAASEMRKTVREALRVLPEAERTVVLLFYVGDQSLKEIGAFLGVPVSTVKGRLHAARTRLKRRMFAMSQESLKEERPSTDTGFCDTVKRTHQARRVARYHTPRLGEEPQPPLDWDALERERDTFEHKLLAGEAVDRKTMKRAVSMIISDLNQFATAADLLNLYLARPVLTPPERAEATRLRLEALCFSGYRGEYVRLHREFLDWIRPFVGTGAMTQIVPDEELMLWAFTFRSAWQLWQSLGHLEEWLTRGRQILAEMPKTARSRRERYYLICMRALALREAGRDEEAWEAIRASGNLSDEADRDAFSPFWRIEMKQMWDFPFEDRTDSFTERGEASRRVIVEELELLVTAYLPTLDPNEEWQATTIASCLNTCATLLYGVKQYERAWAYFERELATGDYSHHTLVRAAATLWKVRGESARSEIVALLQRASVRPDARPGWVLEEFRRTKEFEGVYDDLEFVTATGPTNGA